MSDRNLSNLPFDTEDPAERELWAALRDLPGEAPSADLRRGFYRELDKASSESFLDRLRERLGFGSNMGWLTATACVLLGFGVASVIDGSQQGTSAAERLATLEQNVELLNRELILARLEDASAGKRLKGVFDARDAAATDEQVARALLQRATNDQVPSVRSAAIDALGPSLANEGVGEALMELLEQTESPTVQLALVDLVLRNGTSEQLARLLELARENRLHPDLVRHVMNSLGSEKA